MNWSGEYLQYGKHLAAPRSLDIFNNENIIIREITGKYPNSIIATYNSSLYLFNMSNISIIKRNNFNISLKYILVVLNSQLMAYYFVKNTAKSVRKMFPKIILNDLRKFPFKYISEKEQSPFIAKADLILSLNEAFISSLMKLQNYLQQKFQLEKLSKKLQNWHELEFGDFIKELNKAIKSTNKARIKEGLEEVPTLTKKDEFEWLDLFEENKQKAQDLQNQINQT
ncbi:TaqI-like C-terminal specificity domain-containing protein, partial [Oceanihabitans sediminis]|uniref:TaqI-like C-terminal specificity domain-containing protein n=1 Tax=Oceanihabitans sediminis TaxID=1812012 RepID=UPI00299E0805